MKAEDHKDLPTEDEESGDREVEFTGGYSWNGRTFSFQENNYNFRVRPFLVLSSMSDKNDYEWLRLLSR